MAILSPRQLLPAGGVELFWLFKEPWGLALHPT